MTGRLAEIVQRGAGWNRRDVSNIIVCRDGFRLSVIANPGAYCLPRLNFPGDGPECWPHGQSSDYPGPFTHLEVGFPSERPEPWEAWEEFCDDPSDPTNTVYSYVPADLIRQLVERHGGEA